jgi:histidinol-phosphate/aromatic aminotransferase/cobyric acid decarboxylase-like protein
MIRQTRLPPPRLSRNTDITDLQILTEPRSQSGTVTVGIQRKLLNLLMQRIFGLEKVVKLASNENPFGCSQAAKDALHQEIEQLALFR